MQLSLSANEQPFKTNTNWELRLLQTFGGVLQKKIRTRAVFKETETPTNPKSKENIKLNKIMIEKNPEFADSKSKQERVLQ